MASRAPFLSPEDKVIREEEMMHGHRGGLSTIVAVFLLIALVLAGMVGLVYYFNITSKGALKPANLFWTGSEISTNVGTGEGMIVIHVRNEGPGPISLLSINITDNSGENHFKIWFGAPPGQKVFTTAGTATIIGSSEVGTAEERKNGVLVGIFLGLPASSTADIVISFSPSDDIRQYFSMGHSYDAIATPLNGPTYMFTLEVGSYS